MIFDALSHSDLSVEAGKVYRVELDSPAHLRFLLVLFGRLLISLRPRVDNNGSLNLDADAELGSGEQQEAEAADDRRSQTENDVQQRVGSVDLHPRADGYFRRRVGRLHDEDQLLEAAILVGCKCQIHALAVDLGNKAELKQRLVGDGHVWLLGVLREDGHLPAEDLEVEVCRLIVQPQLVVYVLEPLMVDGDDVLAVSARIVPRAALDPDRLLRVARDLLVLDSLVFIAPVHLYLFEREARRLHEFLIAIVREAEA